MTIIFNVIWQSHKPQIIVADLADRFPIFVKFVWTMFYKNMT